MKAIQTRYAGCHFRSRLEARWAVFLDRMRVHWLYEAEGFELAKSGRYLPDFFLPDSGAWLEVKGSRPTQREVHCALELAYHLSMEERGVVRMLAGDMPRAPQTIAGVSGIPILRAQPAYIVMSDERGLVGEEDVHIFDQGMVVSGRQAARTPVEEWQLGQGHWGFVDASAEEIQSALTAARSARFEHGERP